MPISMSMTSASTPEPGRVPPVRDLRTNVRLCATMRRVTNEQDEGGRVRPAEINAAVVGLGDVGLPLVVAFAQAGAGMVAVDVLRRSALREAQARNDVTAAL